MGYELQVCASGEALGDDVKIVFYDKKGQVTIKPMIGKIQVKNIEKIRVNYEFNTV